VQHIVNCVEINVWTLQSFVHCIALNLNCPTSRVHDFVTDSLKMVTAEDKKLPCVQPIHVTMPENYPENSPTCSTLLDESGKYPMCDSY